MRMQYSYPATLVQDEDGRYVVHFPDLPEALTDGADENEAIAEAVDCLSEALASRIVDGEDIPRPSQGAGQYLISPDPTIALKASLYTALRRRDMTVADLADLLRMGDWHQAARLIDPKRSSKLTSLAAALDALGCTLEITISDNDEVSAPVTSQLGEIDATVAEIHRQLAKAPAGIDAELTEAHILAFFENGTPFTHAQQRLLFADPPTRERFLALRRQYAIAEIQTQIAAADARGVEFERPFAGGMLKVTRVGIGEQVYVLFRFDNPEVATRVLILERTRDERLEWIELPPPDAGEILLIKDLAIPEEAALIELLRDPNTSGEFQ